MDTIYKTFPADIAVDETHRRMTFTISTGSVDRDNDTIDPKGWQLDSYRKNAVVLFAHDYHSLPVAKTIDIQSTDSALIATAEFPDKGVYPFADTVYDMLKGGFLNATSVGFRGIEHSPNEQRKGLDYKRQELMEYSIVPIPSNPEALVSQRGLKQSDPIFKQWQQDMKAWFDKALETPAVIRLKALLPKGTTFTKVLGDSNWEALERDYDVESDGKDLSALRLGKLLTLHGFDTEAALITQKEPDSADPLQAAAIRQIHRAAMDPYANAHHADTVMTSMATMEANIPTAGVTDLEAKAMTDRLKRSMKQAQSAVQRAKDHAMDAADLCSQMAQHGGKLDTTAIQKAAEAQAILESEKQQDADIVFELLDSDPNLLDIDEQLMTSLVGELTAQAIGTSTRAALNAALGRLD